MEDEAGEPEAAGEAMEDEAGEPEVAQSSEAMEAEAAVTEDAAAEPEVAQSEAMEAEAAAEEAEAEAAVFEAVAQKLVGRARAAAMAPEQRRSQEPWEGQQPDETRPARCGWLRRTVSPILSETRYGDVYRFNMYASVLVPKTGQRPSKAASHHVVTINRKFTSRKETYDERLEEAAAELNHLIWAKLKPFMADHRPQKRRRFNSAGAGSAGAAAEEPEKASEGSDDEDNSPPAHHGRGGARPGCGATPVELHWRTGLGCHPATHAATTVSASSLRCRKPCLHTHASASKRCNSSSHRWPWHSPARRRPIASSSATLRSFGSGPSRRRLSSRAMVLLTRCQNRTRCPISLETVTRHRNELVPFIAIGSVSGII